MPGEMTTCAANAQSPTLRVASLGLAPAPLPAEDLGACSSISESVYSSNGAARARPSRLPHDLKDGSNHNDTSPLLRRPCLLGQHAFAIFQTLIRGRTD